MQRDEFTAMLEADERHWWYRGRRRVVHAALGTLDIPREARVLDAGCGSGRTLDELVRYGRVAGVDTNALGIERARSRGHSDVHVAPIEQLPFEDAAFSLVTCLDVVEHTENDRRSLTELRRVTEPGGHLLVTVPAYQALWSTHDVVNQHHRRYRKRVLREVAAEAGWQLIDDTYFNSLLLPPAAAVRLLQRRSEQRPADRSEAWESDLRLTPRWLDRVLEAPLRAEAAAISHGFRFPAGLSLLAIFRNSGLPVDGPAAIFVDRHGTRRRRRSRTRAFSAA